MFRIAHALALTATVLAGCAASTQAQTAAPAQQTGQAAQAAAPSPACPPSATLDQLISALDAAITGPANKDRTCMKQLMLPQLRLIPVNPDTGTPRVLTLDDWIAAVSQRGTDLITEKQLKFQSETFGHIAHLWSTYETYDNGQMLGRGINSIQAVFDGQNWKVMEIVWQGETPATRIPAQYLP